MHLTRYGKDMNMDHNANDIEIQEIRTRVFDLILAMPDDELRKLLKYLDERQKLRLSDKREHNRKKVSIEAECKCNDVQFKDSIEDISYGGVFIKTDEQFSIGQEIMVSFSIPRLKINNNITLIGEVVRIVPDGVGVRFIKPAPFI